MCKYIICIDHFHKHSHNLCSESTCAIARTIRSHSCANRPFLLFCYAHLHKWLFCTVHTGTNNFLRARSHVLSSGHWPRHTMQWPEPKTLQDCPSQCLIRLDRFTVSLGVQPTVDCDGEMKVLFNNVLCNFPTTFSTLPNTIICNFFGINSANFTTTKGCQMPSYGSCESFPMLKHCHR